MRIFQSRSFEQKIKKMPKKEKGVLDQHIKMIPANPLAGEQKKGDLKGVYVYKVKLQVTQYLLAYRWVGEDLELIMIGAHENYYRDLKQYLKNR